jgi:hypothetical protein
MRISAAISSEEEKNLLFNQAFTWKMRYEVIFYFEKFSLSQLIILSVNGHCHKMGPAKNGTC